MRIFEIKFSKIKVFFETMLKIIFILNVYCENIENNFQYVFKQYKKEKASFYT